MACLDLLESLFWLFLLLLGPWTSSCAPCACMLCAWAWLASSQLPKQQNTSAAQCRYGHGLPPATSSSKDDAGMILHTALLEMEVPQWPTVTHDAQISCQSPLSIAASIGTGLLKLSVGLWVYCHVSTGTLHPHMPAKLGVLILCQPLRKPQPWPIPPNPR